MDQSNSQDQDDNQGPIYNSQDQDDNQGPIYNSQDQDDNQGPIYNSQDQDDNQGPIYNSQDQDNNQGPVYYYQNQYDNQGPVYYHQDQANNQEAVNGLDKMSLLRLIGEKQTDINALLKRKVELVSHLNNLQYQLTQAHEDRAVSIIDLSKNIKLERDIALKTKILEKELIAQSNRRKEVEARLRKQVEETSKNKISLALVQHEQEKVKSQWEDELSRLIHEHCQEVSCLNEKIRQTQEDRNKERLQWIEKRTHLLEILKNTKQALDNNKKEKESIISKAEKCWRFMSGRIKTQSDEKKKTKGKWTKFLELLAAFFCIPYI